MHESNNSLFLVFFQDYKNSSDIKWIKGSTGREILK